jgi:hypothetical protein
MGAQTAMPARTGKESLHGLKDERQIWWAGSASAAWWTAS